MPYNMQQTEQIPNDPLQMGAKITTTSNHPSTPRVKWGNGVKQGGVLSPVLFTLYLHCAVWSCRPDVFCAELLKLQQSWNVGRVYIHKSVT